MRVEPETSRDEDREEMSKKLNTKTKRRGMNPWMWMAMRKKKSRQMKAAIAEMTATTAKTRMRADTPASNHTVYIYIDPYEEIWTSQYLHEIIHAYIYLWINTNSA
jgi:hypothetical protein